MGLGMLGIFLVTAVIILLMVALTHFFRDKPEEKQAIVETDRLPALRQGAVFVWFFIKCAY